MNCKIMALPMEFSFSFFRLLFFFFLCAFSLEELRGVDPVARAWLLECTSS